MILINIIRITHFNIKNMKSFTEFLKEYLFLEAVSEKVFKNIDIKPDGTFSEAKEDDDEENLDYELDDLPDRYGSDKDDSDEDEGDDEGDTEEDSDETSQEEPDETDLDNVSVDDSDEQFKADGKDYYNSEWENAKIAEFKATSDPEKKREIATKLFENKKRYIVKLVNNVYPIIEPFLLSNSKNVKTKADVLAEANYLFMKLLNSFDPSKGSLTNYLKTNLVPRLINLGRTNKKDGKDATHVSIDDTIKSSDGDKDQKIGDTIPDDSKNAGDISDEREKTAILIDLVKKLPKNSRKIIEMMFPEAFGKDKERATNQEIAEFLGKNNAQSGKNALKAVYSKLKEELEKLGINESPF